MFEIALDILKQIENNGFKAYIIGGYPRDKYLNIPSVDIDITTNATPKELKEIFNDINLPNEQYGSVVIVRNKMKFEITTFRKEIKYKDKRYPVKIKYIDNLLEDLKRRDFTINTLCIDSKGNTIDLLNAKEDINHKIIRSVGNPKTKIKEDALRILRALRFATTLNFEIDKDLKKYMKKYASNLKKLSYNRKQEELNKIFSSPNSEVGLKLISELKLAKYLELNNFNNVKPTTAVIGLWAQLNVLDIYNFSNNEKQTIKSINELLNKDVLNNENLYKYGLYVSTIVGEIKNIDRKTITQKYNELYIKNRGEIALKANDICNLLNKAPGPFLKEIIRDLEMNIVNKELENDISTLKQYVLKKYKDIK